MTLKTSKTTKDLFKKSCYFDISIHQRIMWKKLNIKIISEGLSDTQDRLLKPLTPGCWKFSFDITWINYILKHKYISCVYNGKQ